jgi:hypothetical protein
MDLLWEAVAIFSLGGNLAQATTILDLRNEEVAEQGRAILFRHVPEILLKARPRFLLPVCKEAITNAIDAYQHIMWKVSVNVMVETRHGPAPRS